MCCFVIKLFFNVVFHFVVYSSLFNHYFQICFYWFPDIVWGWCHFLSEASFLLGCWVRWFHRYLVGAISDVFHLAFELKTLSLLDLLFTLDLLCHISNLVSRDSWVEDVLVHINFVVQIFKMIIKSGMLSFGVFISHNCSSNNIRQFVPFFRWSTPKVGLSLVIGNTWVLRLNFTIYGNVFFLSFYYSKLFLIANRDVCILTIKTPNAIKRIFLFGLYLFLFVLNSKRVLLILWFKSSTWFYNWRLNIWTLDGYACVQWLWWRRILFIVFIWNLFLRWPTDTAFFLCQLQLLSCFRFFQILGILVPNHFYILVHLFDNLTCLKCLTELLLILGLKVNWSVVENWRIVSSSSTTQTSFICRFDWAPSW